MFDCFAASRPGGENSTANQCDKDARASHPMPTDSNSGFLYRLILGALARAPQRVRERMLETIPTTPLSLATYSATLLLICGTTVWISRGAAWAWVWLGLSVLLVIWRAVHPWYEKRKGRPLPLVSLMLASGLAMASFGFGCAMSIHTGDIALTTMALSGIMGVMAGVATRWAALPRPALATMILSVLPPMVVLAVQGGGHLMAALALGFSAVSIATFMTHNREVLLASITAGEMLRRKAQTDHLTGLANRAELMQRLEDACGELPGVGRGRGRPFAVLYVDLDGFKAVNDNHGHAAGDEMLQRVAACLHQVVGPDELVARIGGDEFVVLLRDSDALMARTVADEIISTIAREHRISDGRALHVGCSVGMSMAPDQGRQPEVLLARADAALYSVKNQGKGQTGLWRALGEA
jgi:diguanylate cyclase (GGDEF)-like protein